MRSIASNVAGPGCRALILGGTGRIGSMLRSFWQPQAQVLWQSRHDIKGFEQAQIAARDPQLNALMGHAQVVMCLAGVTHSADGDIDANISLAVATIEAARRAGVRRVLLASSAAVYGRGAALWSEEARCQPLSDYGRAKLEMERQAAARAGAAGIALCILRIANVAGADAILGGWRAGMQIDQLASGATPRRSYIGPSSLAQVCARLMEAPALPAVLNIAAPGAVEMGGLLDAAGLAWTPRRAAAGVIPEVVLDTAKLQQLVPLEADAACAPTLVAEARAWQNMQEAGAS